MIFKKIPGSVITVFCIFCCGMRSAQRWKGEKADSPSSSGSAAAQFLASFTGAKDIEGAKSRFESFVTGETESGED